ncbi:MAG: heat-inducible transcriptional repressor HrcA [Actinobacteria bacterium]|nr:heat-inducible transcriptional repressor HrcA [Actinomycetota bacterium]
MTADKVLDDRKSAILRAIISHYVRFGEPVGSKTLVAGYGLQVSPATVRNEMMALEDAGLIYQPHTSAGRIPTDAGYRAFVDAFGDDPRLPATEARRIKQFFGEPRWELEDALRQTASLLSNLTDHAAVVFAPALDRSVVRHVELVRLGGGRAMLVLVTDTGRVENHVVSVPEPVDEVQLDQTAEMLRKMLLDVQLEHAAQTIEDGMGRFPLEYRAVASIVAASLVENITDRESSRVFLEGTSNIVDEQKFSDLETVRQVIGALEHRRLLLEVVADGLSAGGVHVRIGSENVAEEMQFCSVITASYGAGETAIGSLGVVGPTRMDYRRTIAAVHEVSSNLGSMLNGLGI